MSQFWSQNTEKRKQQHLFIFNLLLKITVLIQKWWSHVQCSGTQPFITLHHWFILRSGRKHTVPFCQSHLGLFLSEFYLSRRSPQITTGWIFWVSALYSVHLRQREHTWSSFSVRLTVKSCELWWQMKLKWDESPFSPSHWRPACSGSESWSYNPTEGSMNDLSANRIDREYYRKNCTESLAAPLCSLLWNNVWNVQKTEPVEKVGSSERCRHRSAMPMLPLQSRCNGTRTKKTFVRKPWVFLNLKAEFSTHLVLVSFNVKLSVYPIRWPDRARRTAT